MGEVSIIITDQYLSLCQFLHVLLQIFSYMMKHDTWGDQAILHTVSVLWQAKATVVNVVQNTIWEYRLRHDDLLEKANMVLVFNGRNHYVAAGKSIRPVKTTIGHLCVSSSCILYIRPVLSACKEEERKPVDEMREVDYD